MAPSDLRGSHPHSASSNVFQEDVSSITIAVITIIIRRIRFPKFGVYRSRIRLSELEGASNSHSRNKLSADITCWQEASLDLHTIPYGISQDQSYYTGPRVGYSQIPSHSAIHRAKLQTLMKF